MNLDEKLVSIDRAVEMERKRLDDAFAAAGPISDKLIGVLNSCDTSFDTDIFAIAIMAAAVITENAAKSPRGIIGVAELLDGVIRELIKE